MSYLRYGGILLSRLLTLDYTKEQQGEQIVKTNVDKNQYRDPSHGLNSALVAMDPRNGQIITYVGSGGPGTPA